MTSSGCGGCGGGTPAPQGPIQIGAPAENETRVTVLVPKASFGSATFRRGETFVASGSSLGALLEMRILAETN